MPRIAISKKTRFEVFKRDDFTCQYCGGHPPTSVLHIDHIHPVSRGGSNDMDNLTTACDVCNLGKSANILSKIPQSLKEKAKALKESEEQLRGYYEIFQAKKDRIESETWDVLRGLGLVEDHQTKNSYFVSVRKFIERIGYIETMEAAEITSSKTILNHNNVLKYFCGVCWNKVKNNG